MFMYQTILLSLLAVACSANKQDGTTTNGGGGTMTTENPSHIGGAASVTGSTSAGFTATAAGRLHVDCSGRLEKTQSSTGLCVAKMATISGPPTASPRNDYSIDVTEVTHGQYQDWLATNPPLPPATDESCGWKTSYAPQGAGLGTTDAEHHPVVNVDWCDARAYCSAVGKRLCGAIGGGSNDYDHPSNAALSQWYRACSSAGTYKYPYGDDYQANACNGLDFGAGTSLAVGTLQTCSVRGANSADVYDLDGNVWEWEDSCWTAGQWGYCHQRGASFASTRYSFGCDFGGYNQRFYAYNYVGFRCCSDVTSTDDRTFDGTGGNAATGTGGTSSVAGSAGTGLGGTAGAIGTAETVDEDHCNTEGPSCDGGLTCNGRSCCQSLLLPAGTYNRIGNNVVFPATIGDVCLDKYEITVGRFRKFAAAYDAWHAAGHPTAGEGAHDAILASGWDASWNGKLPTTGTELTDANHVNCASASKSATWRDTVGTAINENYPLNCLNWFQAFAFCIWDGGYLPTEAEWQYAVVGGAEEQNYTWGSDATEPFPANYCSYMDLDHCTPYVAVGSYPGSNARWGHADLAGGVWEWALDWYRPSLPSSCVNCANLTTGSTRAIRGGGWVADPWDLESSYRASFSTTFPDERIGARCARAPR